MRQLLPAFAVLLLPCSGLAQAQANLLNGDFESTSAWVNGRPVDWNWFFSNSGGTISEATANSNVFNGAKSLKMVPGTGLTEFGKQWKGSVPVGIEIAGTFRIKLSNTAMASKVEVVAYEFNLNSQTNPWTAINGTKHTVTAAPTLAWQELTIKHEVEPRGTFPGQPDPWVRIGVQVNGAAAGDFLFLDYAVFNGADTHFNDGNFPDHELQSSDFSLLVGGNSGNLLHLRPRDQGEVKKLGGNLLSSTDESTLWQISGPAAPPSGSPFFMASGATGTGGLEPSLLSWTEEAGASPAVIRVERIGQGDPVDVAVEISASASSPGITFSPGLVSDPTTVVNDVIVPLLRLPFTLGSTQDDDRYFFPGGDGSVVFPAKGIQNEVVEDMVAYPGGASMQLLAFFDDDHGFSLSGQDLTGEAKVLKFRHEKDSANAPEMFIRHKTPEVAGAVINSFDLVIEPCSGSWMEATKNYRDWVFDVDGNGTPAPWASPPARASWINERPTSFFGQLMPLQMGLPLIPLKTDLTTPDPQPWTDVMDAWESHFKGAVLTDSPMMPFFQHFEQLGMFCSGPRMLPLVVRGKQFQPASGFVYDEVYTEAQISAMWNELVDEGHFTAAMVAGLKWARSRPQSPAILCELVQGAEQRGRWVPQLSAVVNQWLSNVPPGEEVCMRDVPAGPAPQFNNGTDWDTNHSRMCAWHPYSKQVYGDFAATMAAAGNRLFHVDQMIGGRTLPCYHQDHTSDPNGHPPGSGKWIYDEVKAFLEEIRDRGRAALPVDEAGNFELSMEGLAELYIPEIASFTSRPDLIHQHPAAGGLVNFAGRNPWGELVPAFQFVYSSVVSTWAVAYEVAHKNDSTNPGFPQDLLKYKQLQIARTFVSGAWMAMRISGNSMAVAAGLPCGSQDPLGLLLPMPDEVDTNNLDLSTHAVRLGQGMAKPYFESARMVRPEGASIPIMENIVALSGAIIQQPTVSLTAWQMDNNGPLGLTLANATYDGPVDISLPTKADGQTISLSRWTRVYDGDQLVTEGTYGSMRNLFHVPAHTALLIEILP